MIISRPSSKKQSIKQWQDAMDDARLNIDTLLPSQDPIYVKFRTILYGAIRAHKGVRDALARLQ